MAYTKIASPVDFMPLFRLRQIARKLELPYDLSTTSAALITAIKAA